MKAYLQGRPAVDRGGDNHVGRFSVEFEVANYDDTVRARLLALRGRASARGVAS